MDEDSDQVSPPVSEKSCNECRRRKARCNRLLPECSNCSKFRRHCLYEKHSKTPLTRRHLTDVEARLERAEALLQRYRRREALERETATAVNPLDNLPLWKTRPDTGEIVESISQLDRCTLQGQAHKSSSSIADHVNTHIQIPQDVLASNDFCWDEQLRPMAFGDSRSYRERVADLVDPIHDEEDDIALDGMATLTLNDKEVGYLGSAAGAAFLKYLWRPPSNCAVNDSSNRSSDARPLSKHTVVSMPPSIDSSKLIADPFIDAYFSLFHSIYPLIHEPTFRAAYSEVIPRPGGEAWTALANIVAAIGAFSSMMRCLSIDTPFYFSAKASLSLDCLETGNVTLVQALILMAEYLQKRNKPNSGYTYAGLAKRMAFGLGLHKEFSADGTRPLQLENRRRLWWSIYVIDSSMSVTLSRPVHSINSAEDAALPANIHENHLTPQTEVLPSPDEGWTNYSALRAQASFYIQVRDLYSSAISNAPVDYQRLIDMDAQYTWGWLEQLPAHIKESSCTIPEKYAFAQAVTLWRLYNLRIIIFRPFILGQSTGNNNKLASTESGQLAQERCLAAARETIKSVSLYWNLHARTRLACWHALYFLFQAVLIPISCLRQTPEIQAAALWKADIRMALDVVEEMHFIHSSKCAAVMHQLADPFLGSMATTPDLNAKSNIKGRSDLLREAVLERGSANLDFVSMNFQDLLQGTSPGQTQGEDAWQIMWPGVPTMESDVTMEEYTGFFPSSQPDTFGVGSAEPNTSDYC